MNRLLADLQVEALRLGVWTGRDRKSTECIFREQALHAWIEATVCGDDLPSHKPDPAGLNEILQRLGVSSSEVLFAGDADVDVLAGHRLGVNTVLIRHGRTVHEDVLRKAWRVVESPEDAYAVIRQAVVRFE